MLLYNSPVNTQDILNIFLILGIITVTSCVVFMTYFFIRTLRAVQDLADHLVDTTENLRNKVGLKALAAIPPILVALIGKFIRRGR